MVGEHRIRFLVRFDKKPKSKVTVKDVIKATQMEFESAGFQAQVKDSTVNYVVTKPSGKFLMTTTAEEKANSFILSNEGTFKLNGSMACLICATFGVVSYILARDVEGQMKKGPDQEIRKALSNVAIKLDLHEQ